MKNSNIQDNTTYYKEKNTYPVKSNSEMSGITYSQIMSGLTVAGIIGFGAFLSTRYRISHANEYIVKTGLFIENVQINKKTFQLPFQQVGYIDMTPKSYTFTLHAMSKEKMEFILPCVFTIGPKDNIEYLEQYSKYLLYEDPDKVSDIIKGMIEGETRVLAANMSIEEIFKGRTMFKTEIVNSVQYELQKLGLSVFNANIKELQDSNESKYFAFLSQKVSADAENQAKIDISEAKKIGEIGKKEREGEERQRLVEIEAQTKIYENQKAQEIAQSQADLEKNQQIYNQITSIAQIESVKNAEKKAEELQREVEVQRLQSQIEMARAKEFSKAKVQVEVQLEEAKGQAESMKQIADAELYKSQRIADSHLYQKQKEAEGIQAVFNAQAIGLEGLVKSFNNDTKGVLSYMMIEKQVYEKMAKESANAIQGLNPKINIWNTGNSNGKDNTFDTFQNLMKSIPPMVETIQDQTDVRFPEWMIKNKDQIQKQIEEQVNKKQQ